MNFKGEHQSGSSYFFSRHIGSFEQDTGLTDPFGHALSTGASQLDGPKAAVSNDAMQHRTCASSWTTQHSCFSPQSLEGPCLRLFVRAAGVPAFLPGQGTGF
jgi:hypothetical protein